MQAQIWRVRRTSNGVIDCDHYRAVAQLLRRHASDGAGTAALAAITKACRAGREFARFWTMRPLGTVASAARSPIGSGMIDLLPD